MGQAFESLRNHSEAVTPVAAFFVFRLKERTPYNIQKKYKKTKIIIRLSIITFTFERIITKNTLKL
ncbi:hypothetical protein JCM10003_3307 [Bacteroides pyogenes JCM 10003]|nr:hypothetical protein JCM10003_3307 [Bacteroides pyogenes JCM 10003]